MDVDLWHRIANNTESDDQCLVWRLHRDTNGYGHIRIDGKTELVHRAAFYAFSGYMPEVVQHTCDNPSCVNPLHLRAGTHSSNVQDRVNKNRSAKGSANGRAKLTEAHVRHIVRHLNYGASIPFLAGCYGVSTKTIRNIRDGRTWRHIGTSGDLKSQEDSSKGMECQKKTMKLVDTQYPDW